MIEKILEKYLPKHVDTPTKYILKYVHFEPFKYDILKLKEDIQCRYKRTRKHNTICI